MIKSAHKWLCAEGHLDREPIKLTRRKAECQRAHCYSVAEVAAMIERCQQSPDLLWLHDVIVTLACTGLRISELASLRWADIRFDDRTLAIADESGWVDQSSDRRSTKNSRTRRLPIHPTLVAVLRSLKKEGAYVFRGPRGGRLKADTVRSILIREVIEPLTQKFPKSYPGQRSFEDGRLHSFRHYFCSRCANRGVAERIVMEWLGHSDSEMAKIYYHLNDGESRRTMDHLDLLGDGGGSSGAGDK